MDPLGIVPEIVDIYTLKKWGEISPREIPEAGLFGNQEKVHSSSPFPCNEQINKKIALWVGDISSLNAQAIVNSTNEVLTDKNALSERILMRAGPQLQEDLQNNIKVCRTGEAKLTKGYNLPARYVIHTVGPKYNVKYQTAAESALFSCYFKVLQIAREHQLKSLALCAINSVRRGYPPHEGAHIALRTVRRFLENYEDSIDIIIFTVEDVDIGIYELLLPLYYPRNKQEEEYGLYYLPVDTGGKDGEPYIPERQIRIVDKPITTNADLGESVDLAAQLDSSVSVGRSAFAKMHGDLDKRRGSQHRNSIPSDNLTWEVQKKNKYERLLRKARLEDLRSIANLKCLYQSGEDKFGRPVIVFIGQRFKACQVDLEKAVLYLIHTLDPIVQQDYVVVYFHSNTGREHHPSLSFIREVYGCLDYKYKKNLRALYIVHPTFWSRILTWWFTTFTASSIKNKVQSLGGVEYLYYLIPPNQLEIPSFIMDYDFRVNGVGYCQPNASYGTDSL
ncbi:protein GDAP2 homolog [Centruroides vittatus]|uniref:protein GDAP2 homolog n=1 Tax=Centruroides vittatus TaxID=120091 RepID=UPI00350FC6A8